MTIIRMTFGGKKLRIKDCSGLSSLRGLMFHDMEGIDGALIYANAVWMPFVRKKLKLFFLDEKKRVLSTTVATPMTLHPKTWKVYKNHKASYVLEIKA